MMETLYEAWAIFWDWKAWVLAATVVFFGWAMLKRVAEGIIVGTFRLFWGVIKCVVPFLSSRKGGLVPGDRAVVWALWSVDKGDVVTIKQWVPSKRRWMTEGVCSVKLWKSSQLIKIEK